MKVLQFRTNKEQQAAVRVDRLITLMRKMNEKSTCHVPVRNHLDDYAIPDSANCGLQPETIDYLTSGDRREDTGEG